MGVSEIKRLRKITLDYGNVVKSTFQFSSVQFQFRIVVPNSTFVRRQRRRTGAFLLLLPEITL